MSDRTADRRAMEARKGGIMSIATMTGRWADRRHGAGGSGGSNQQPFEALTAFIPVEAITLFIAAVSMLSAATPVDDGAGLPEILGSIDIRTVYFVFGLAVTPVIVLLVAGGKWKEAHKADPTTRFRWPIWPIIAAVIAFLAWAWAVPGLAESDFEKILAAFAATFVSTILALLDRVFG